MRLLSSLKGLYLVYLLVFRYDLSSLFTLQSSSSFGGSSTTSMSKGKLDERDTTKRELYEKMALCYAFALLNSLFFVLFLFTSFGCFSPLPKLM